MRAIAVILSVVLAAALLPVAAVAQQKTVKQCETEWRANKAANQAKGITLKAYVAQCRAGGAAAAPSKAKAPEKTKASETKAKKTKPAKQTATPPAPAAAPTTPAAPRAKPAARPSSTIATAPTGAKQYASEAQAKLRCGASTVVWANLDSKIYHFSGYKAYGATKSGAYMCERDAAAQGMRAAKNEKHP